MKVKFLPVVLLLLLVGLWLPSASVDAQDKGLSPNELLDPNHSELNFNEDKTLVSDPEPKSKAPAKDSAAIRSNPSLITPVTKLRSFEHKSFAGKDEDDALSFNFLYYIIQKFKISDLIDD